MKQYAIGDTAYIVENGIRVREVVVMKQIGQNLVDDLKLSSATVAKMGKGEPVSFKVMDKLSEFLECDVNDLIKLQSSKNKADKLLSNNRVAVRD